MFDQVFLFKVVLSFVVGGAAVSIAVLAGERFGPKAAGIIIGLPIVSAVGLFFIGLTQTPQTAASAAAIMPLTLMTGIFFLLIFVYAYGRFGLWISLALATLSFFFFGWLFVQLAMDNIIVNSVIHFFAVIVALRLVSRFPDIKVSFRPGWPETLKRAAFAGAVISSSVVVAKFAGPYFGGVAAAFPASYFSTVLISTPLHGLEFTKSIVKSVPLATLGTLLYYLAVNQLYPAYGIIFGTLAGYAVAITWVFLAEKLGLSRLLAQGN